MKKVVLIILMIIVVVGGYFGYGYYKLYSYGNEMNVIASGESKLMVEKDISFDQLGTFLKNNGIINSEESFNAVLEYKGLKSEILKPGLLKISSDWNNKTLINQIHLARNKGEVEATFNNVRLKEDLAGKICKYVKADSAAFLALLNDEEFCARYGFNQSTIMTMFLPDTYELKYETSEEELFQRMAKEYKSFWNEERIQKAKELGLSQSQISILASIVQAEQSRNHPEQATIAGLYINRINRNMLLQSDPTLIFALKDFSIKRVLNVHKEVESPYNTYKYTGLPPGPINLPEKYTLEHVLNAAKHDYIYMCAKPEAGGTHNFAKSYNQHLKYAREYQKWISSQGY